MVVAIGASPAEARRIVAARAKYAFAIEPLAGYQGQTTCSPVAKPGVVDMSKRLLRAFPTTRSLGIVRACSVGGQSEHKEGRAFDWGGLNAHSAKDRARVARMMHWLTKTDKYGNRYAMLRRLGIQYLIWNHKIFGSYSATSGWRKYSGANPHTDHVHISFTWAGARKQTSFWTGKVGNVGAAPTPTLPPTTPVPPKPPTGDTIPPRPAPAPEAYLLPGTELEDETVTLQGASPGQRTFGALTAGQPYLIEASGTWHWGRQAAKIADAECSTTVTDPTWRSARSVHTMDPTNQHLDLYVDGNDMIGDPDTDTGGLCDTANHTYRWTYTPTRTGRVVFASWDPTPLDDNSGALTIRVLKAVPVDYMTWSVSGKAGAGVTSPGMLIGGETYALTVSGTVATAPGVSTDAECSKTMSDPSWQHDRTPNPSYPGADRLDVLVDKQPTTFSAGTTGDSSSCDVTNHFYRTLLTPHDTRAINVRVDDPTPSDNVGALTVTATRVVQPTGPETVSLNPAAPAGVQTARTYLAGRPVNIRATGSYSYGGGVTADAECSRTTTDTNWLETRPSVLGDVTVGNVSPPWLNATGTACDAATHVYTLSYTPLATGPLSFGIADTVFTDNSGTVSITVTP
jgi:hypothetical protein